MSRRVRYARPFGFRLRRLRGQRWYEPPVGHNGGNMRRRTQLFLFPFFVGRDRPGIVAIVVTILIGPIGFGRISPVDRWPLSLPIAKRGGA
jgi:hypothetical protein